MRAELKNILVWVFVVCGIVCSFVGMQYPGLGYGDEGYQLLCIDNYMEAPAGMLSYYIARGWQEIFGDSVIGMRVLASLLTTAAVAVGCLYMCCLTRDKLASAVMFFCCVITARISDFNLFNWETGSFLFASVSLLLMLSLLKSVALWKYLLLGVFLALTAMAKITMIIEVVPAIIVAAYVNKGKTRQAILAVSVGFAGFLVALLSVTQFMTGGIACYIAAFVPDNITSGHTAGDWSRYVDRFLDSMPFQLAVWGPAILCMPMAVLFHKLGSVGKIVLICMYVMWSAMTLWLFDNLSDYEYPLLGCGMPLLVYVVCFAAIWNRCAKRSDKLSVARPVLWVIFGYVLLIGFGSDSSFERCTIVFALPMAVGELWLSVKGRARRLLVNILAVGFAGIITMWGCRMVMEARLGIYDGSEFTRCQYLKLNQRVYSQLSEVANAIECLDKDGCDYVIFGDRYPALAVFGNDNGLSIHQFGQLLHDGPAGIDRLKTVASGRDAVLLVAPAADNCTELESMLYDEGFYRDTYDTYTRVYRRGEMTGTNACVPAVSPTVGRKVPERFRPSLKKSLRYWMLTVDLLLYLMALIWYMSISRMHRKQDVLS